MMDEPTRLPWDTPRFRNWIALVRAEKAVFRALGKALAPLNLKVAQLEVMIHLYKHPAMSQHDVARKLLVGRSNVTMLLPQMEEQGIVRRENDANDRRVMRLYLTGEGEALLKRAIDVYSGLIERVMAHASANDCERMGEHMRRIEEMLLKD